MIKKVVLAGVAAAVVLGAGTAALAASGGGSSPSPAASSAGSSTGQHPHAGRAQLGRNLARRSLHATWVTRDGSGFVTHDAIRGQVTAVSAGSITVKAADDVSQTYAVTGDTRVHVRADGKGKAGSIGEVKTGDRVIVLGTGTSSLTATRVLDGVK